MLPAKRGRNKPSGYWGLLAALADAGGEMNWELALQLLGLFSVLSFVISLICIPWMINRLDRCFFTIKSHRQRLRKRREQHPVLMIIIGIVRHCAGFILMAAGLAMLFMPGQGILAILLALVLMDFPGKYKLIIFIVQQQRVRLVLNWIRVKGSREPFVFDDDMAPG